MLTSISFVMQKRHWIVLIGSWTVMSTSCCVIKWIFMQLDLICWFNGFYDHFALFFLFNLRQLIFSWIWNLPRKTKNHSVHKNGYFHMAHKIDFSLCSFNYRFHADNFFLHNFLIKELLSSTYPHTIQLFTLA